MSHEEKRADEIKAWEEMTIAEHVAMYERQGIDHKEAMRRAARDRGLTRRDVYQALLQEDASADNLTKHM
jgi:16S rRNA (cytidine1402-2'-O)-methyltransferase